MDYIYAYIVRPIYAHIFTFYKNRTYSLIRNCMYTYHKVTTMYKEIRKHNRPVLTISLSTIYFKWKIFPGLIVKS